MTVTWLSSYSAELTPLSGDHNVWLDRDLSAYIPAGATGALLWIQNTDVDGTTLEFGYRSNGCTGHNVKGSIINLYHQIVAVGVDANRVCELYFGMQTYTPAWSCKVVGYLTDESYFLGTTAPKAYTPSVTTWTDCDLSASPSMVQAGDTPVMAFVQMVTSTTSSDTNVRPNGSSETTRQGAHLYSQGMGFVGVNSNIFEAYRQHTTTTFYCHGYIKQGGATAVDPATTYSGDATGWDDFTAALPAGALGGFFDVVGGGTRTFGMRRKGDTGITQTGSITSGVHYGYTAGADVNRIITGNKSNLTQITFYLTAYPTTYTAPQNATVQMSCPAAIADDLAPTSTRVQNRNPQMSIPGAIADDLTPTVSRVQNRNPQMSCPAAVADELLVTPVLSGMQQDKTVTFTTLPSAVADVLAPTVSIRQDRAVAMSCPSATADDLALTVSRLQSRSVSMPIPDAVADDLALTVSRLQSRSVAMSLPAAIADDLALTTAIRQDRSVAMSCPSAAADDLALTTAIEQSRSIAMSCPAAVADELTLTPSRISNPSVAMSIPSAIADVLAVTPNLSGNKTVAMSCPGAVADDLALTTSRTCNPSVAMSLPAAIADDLALTTHIRQDRAVSMSCPDAVADELTVTPSLESNIRVAMSCPSAIADDYALTISRVSNPSIAMPCPTAIADVLEVTAYIPRDATVSMSCPGCVAEVNPITTQIVAAFTVAKSLDASTRAIPALEASTSPAASWVASPMPIVSCEASANPVHVLIANYTAPEAIEATYGGE